MHWLHLVSSIGWHQHMNAHGEMKHTIALAALLVKFLIWDQKYQINTNQIQLSHICLSKSCSPIWKWDFNVFSMLDKILQFVRCFLAMHNSVWQRKHFLGTNFLFCLHATRLVIKILKSLGTPYLKLCSVRFILDMKLSLISEG